ncbi:GET complex subunit get1 [Lecanora helva]
MPSLLLIVFLLQLFIHLVNTVGAPVITEFLWQLYNKLPTTTSKDVKTQRELSRELLKLRRELNATSSQDEFAKWAKIRRQHDKLEGEYDEKSNALKSFKQTFDRTTHFLRWIGTNGLRFFLQFWFAKQPLFWIPRGWVPGYVEWLLAFPRAPTGSVSIQMWGIACATVIQLVGAAAVAGVVLVGEGRGAERGAMPMGRKDGEGEKGGKKEL